MNKICGVYLLRLNNKVYVGSARDINERIHKHFNLLRRNKHYNKKLQQAYIESGMCSLDSSLIEEVYDVNKLVEREQYWMDYYQSYNFRYGYNINRYANNPWEVPLVIKNCLNCGKEYSGKPNEVKRRKYCSRKCADSSKIPWNMGLTKDTSKKVELAAIKNSIVNTGRKKEPFIKEHKEKLRQSNLGKNKGKSRPKTKQFIENMKVRAKTRSRDSFGHFIKEEQI